MSGGGGGDPGSPGPSWTVRRSPRPSHSVPRPREVSTWGEAMVTDHHYVCDDHDACDHDDGDAGHDDDDDEGGDDDDGDDGFT